MEAAAVPDLVALTKSCIEVFKDQYSWASSCEDVFRLEIQVMVFDPSLWGTLPKELLDLVFARLHVAGIGQLRVLSKEWKKNVDCKDSEFNQALDATTHLNMFAFVPLGNLKGWGYIYDVQAHKCHVYKLNEDFGEDGTWNRADGGLVCFVSRWTWLDNKRGVCYVMNPLKKQTMQLPPLLCTGAKKSNTQQTLVRMVKLTMDKKTKNYEIFVLTSHGIVSKDFFAQVYDSHIKKWMVVEETHGRIIGWDHLGRPLDIGLGYGLCMYNCADGTLQHFHEPHIALGLDVKQDCCGLLEDHLFVLYKEESLSHGDLLEDGRDMLPKYCISEFHLPEKATTWVKLKVHSCGPCKRLFEKPPSIINLRLTGCNGFLLVYGSGCKPAWLYNLSTYEWRTLPTFEHPGGPRMMCTLSWSAMA